MLAKKIRSFYSLNSAKKVLRKAVRLYRRKETACTPESKARLEALLHGLQTAIAQKDAEISSRIARQLEEALITHIPHSRWDRARNFMSGIGFALLVAIAVRQMWFELYSIPTGSARPTINEGDYVFVSKTPFGINTPLRSGHLTFDPKLVERGSIVVLTGENMDMSDDSMMYFYVLPGKKQYVKRLIGKPGDTLYFYGGQIYGVNARGRELTELREPAYFQSNEHIPFIRFEGKVVPNAPPLHGGIYPSVTLYQMNQPVATLKRDSREMISLKSKATLSQYSDLWGFKHFAMSRLLTKGEAERIHPRTLESLEPGVLYLELNHHPSLQGSLLTRDERGRIRPALSHSVSLLPLTQEHVNALMSHMTTGRFEVLGGKAYRFGSAGTYDSGAPEMAGVPDGIYEFQDGRASKVSGQGFWSYVPFASGHTQSLKADHPLLSRDPAHVQKLYNFGIEWHTAFAPTPNSPLPSRYAYFRNGDLYLMGGSVVKKGDPLLTLFLKREYQRQAISTSITPYFPFEDSGPPLLASGALDVAFIKQYGITIPEKMYMALGDNHAMSADSREFGFVPQNNLRGTATFHFWPPGERWGFLPQPTTPLALPTVMVWAIATAAIAASVVYNRRKDAQLLARIVPSSSQ